jgi:hypothetical protein
LNAGVRTFIKIEFLYTAFSNLYAKRIKYLFFKTPVSIALSGQRSLISKISGIFLITVLLGYGLVAVPRAIWRIRDFNITLRFYYYKLSETEESLTEC